MWKQLQHILSLTADLLQVGGFFGLTPALIVTAVLAIVGFASKIPVFYLVIGVIVVFASSVYLTRWLIVRIGAISLNDGARIAYEQLRGTVWAAAAERLRVDSSPNGILDYIATGISAEVPVFGKFPPSTKLERIPSLQLKSGSIKDGGRILQLRDQHNTQIVELTVRKSDLRKAIRLMKT
jgi:hypothetical protein